MVDLLCSPSGGPFMAPSVGLHFLQDGGVDVLWCIDGVDEGEVLETVVLNDVVAHSLGKRLGKIFHVLEKIDIIFN